MCTRRAILHIGSHKTGTSAIQFSLSKNRRSLGRQGFFYPYACKWIYDHSHNFLVFSMLKSKETGDKSIFEKQMSELEREIEHNQSANMIFSSEMLEKTVFFAPKLLNEFLSMLKKHFNDIDIVYCFRDEISLCDSAFKQQVQSNKFDGEPKSFVAESKHEYDFLNIAKRWRDTGFVRNIDCYWYSNDFNENFILFSKIIGLNPEITNPGIRNESLNGKLLAIKHALNKKSMDQSQHSFVIDEFRGLLGKLDNDWVGPTTIFDDDSRSEFDRYYSNIDYNNQRILNLRNKKSVPEKRPPLFRPISTETAISYANELKTLGYKRLAKFILSVLQA